jgi:ubiquinone/menaquinone biosynthesis C-methylase UbiE
MDSVRGSTATIDPEFVSILACVKCGGHLAVGDAALRCEGCGAAYEVRDGVVMMADAHAGIRAFEDAHGVYFSEEETVDFGFYRARNQYLPSIFEGCASLLDLGGGDGVVAQYFQSRMARVVLQDMCISPLERAGRVRAVSRRVWADVETRLPYRSETFDGVFIGDVLEHLWAPRNAVSEAQRLLKPHGVLAVSVPNMGWWYRRLRYLYHGNIGCQEAGRRIEPWEYEHIRFYNLTEMQRLFRTCGIEPVAAYPVLNAPPCWGRIRLLPAALERWLAPKRPGLFGGDIVVVGRKQPSESGAPGAGQRS